MYPSGGLVRNQGDRRKEIIVSIKNEGTIDRVLRITLGAVMLAVGWTGVVEGAPGAVLGVLGFVPLLTGLVGWCPIYALFGVSTCPTEGRSIRRQRQTVA